MKQVLVLLLGWIFLASDWAFAREYYDLFPTPKGRSMGGALTAIVDDYNSVSYNPAGLALIDESSLRLPEILHVNMSSNVLDFYKELQSFGDESSSGDIASVLRRFDGKGLGFGVDTLAVGWYRKRIAISFNPLSMNAAFRIRVPSILFAKVNMRMTNDSAVSVSYGHPFFNNRLRLGATLRPLIVRGGFEKQLNGGDLQGVDFIGMLGFGWGSDMDFGFQGNLEPISVLGFSFKPMIGATLQNVFASPLNKSVTERFPAVPPGLERRINIGTGLSFGNMGAFIPVVSFEWRDLMIQTDDSLEHIHAAIELGFKPRRWYQAFLRGHFAKGNVGGGLAGKLWAAELEVGTYAVNMGKGPGIGRDRRSYVSLATNW